MGFVYLSLRVQAPNAVHFLSAEAHSNSTDGPFCILQIIASRKREYEKGRGTHVDKDVLLKDCHGLKGNILHGHHGGVQQLI